MAQQDFERFKKEIKDWLDSHPKEYDTFVAEVNDKSASGLHKIYKLGCKLAPQMMRKYKSECHGDLANENLLQSYSADSDAAKLLVEEFRNVKRNSIVPAMLAWLYYGKCYETMVTQLETEANNPSNNFFEKKVAAIMVKLVIKSSIRNNLRTKEEWQNFYREKKSIEENRILEASIEELTSDENPIKEEEQQKEKQPVQTLKDYLQGNQERVLELIKQRVATQHTGADLARLYFALQEEELLSGCDVATFHRLLAQEMPNCDLKTVRNLQVSVKKLNDSTNKGKIKDCGIERSFINEWRYYSGSDAESAFESGYAVAEIAFKGCRSKTIVRPAPVVRGNPVRGKREKNIIGRGPGKNRNNLELCPTVVARCGGCCSEDFC